MNHPYDAFEADRLWRVVSNAVSDLIENGDVAKQTSREYIVGTSTGLGISPCDDQWPSELLNRIGPFWDERRVTSIAANW